MELKVRSDFGPFVLSFASDASLAELIQRTEEMILAKTGEKLAFKIFKDISMTKQVDLNSGKSTLKSLNIFNRDTLILKLMKPDRSKKRKAETSSNIIDLSQAEDNLRIQSFNVWFEESVEVSARMRSISQMTKSAHVACFQEVTPLILAMLKSNLPNWTFYSQNSFSPYENAAYFVAIAFSPHPDLEVIDVQLTPFENSRMGRGLLTSLFEFKQKPILIATSHFESPVPGNPGTNVRTAQLGIYVNEI